jgi:2-hydroxychromene-2-carboxylate isomerase
MSPESWFELASTSSHAAAHRVAPLARAAGVTVPWRPLLLGAILQHRREDALARCVSP